MVGNSRRTIIFILGTDDGLAYLIQRFGDNAGFETIIRKGVPDPSDLEMSNPTVIIFSSLEQLESAQKLVETLAPQEVLTAVCVSPFDEMHARELGADVCLLHPLTFEVFNQLLG